MGCNVGDAVGIKEGRDVGIGVGRPRVYVGFRVGSTVGAFVGDALGSGVGKNLR